jgi:GNAT superfamily N-acetyltransferase
MAGNTLTINQAKTQEEKMEFIRFPWEVYRGDPNWVPPLVSERVAFLDRKKHPFHWHSDVEYFLARRDGEVVGTIAAIHNKRHVDLQEENVGFFGLFEVLQDREAAEALLDRAGEWLAERGLTSMRGPASYSQNEEVGLLVDGWDGPPVVLMTYNPRYYVDLIEGAGFERAMDLLAYDLDLRALGRHGENLPPKLRRVAKKIEERGGFTVRPMKMSNFDVEVARFKQIYNSAWSRNWGFVPLTEDEIDHLAEGMKQILDPSLLWLAEKDGQPIGAMVPLPDLNQALIRAYPRPDVPEWWTMVKLLWHWKVRRRVTRMRGFAGGVIERYQGRGVDAVLMLKLAEQAVKRYDRCEISWILENNLKMRQTCDLYGAEVYRTYRLYERAL